MTHLTPASLLSSLEVLAAASSEAERRARMDESATLLQDAVLAGGAREDFDAAIDSVLSGYQSHLNAVMNRSVNFHVQADGSALGLWLVPVMVAVDGALLPSILPLEAGSMNQLKLSGLLLKQMGLNTAFDRVREGKRGAGWAYILPSLYSMEQITGAELPELVSVPQQAKATIRGERLDVIFDCGAMVAPRKGQCLYYLPVVFSHPDGIPAQVTMTADEVMAARLRTWVEATIRQSNDGLKSRVSCLGAPSPFTFALDAGERFELDFKVRELLSSVSASVNVHAHGMAALVAPYSIPEAETFALGVTLVSRMTNAILATLTVPLNTDGLDEASWIKATLIAAGVASVEVRTEPVESYVCQHCGGVQHLAPSPQFANVGVAEMAANIH